MCGIVGYIGNKNASNVIVKGLKMLEYRGYDSSGITVYDGEKLVLRKYKGRLAVLEEDLKNNPLKGFAAIGHTRWATHGEPSDENAHPHMNEKKTISVVHNGIIENYMGLRKELKEKGYKFQSDTDTEVIVHLIDSYYKDDLLDAVMKAIKKLKGAYAIGVISSLEPDKLIAARKDSPLIIGLGKNEKFIASDVPALLEHTKRVIYALDGDIIVLKKDSVKIFDANKKEIKRKENIIEWDLEAATKGGYPHFMLKEIFEEPKAVKETFERRLNSDGIITLDDINMTKEFLTGLDKIYIIACGTAYYAGLIGKSIIENLVDIPVEVDIASEFRYKKSFITKKTLVIIVSQSGETLDTLVALKESKKKGATILAITNVVGSSIVRESDNIFYTWAGPEIAVASTKAYVTQLTAFYMIALDMAYKTGKINLKRYKEIIAKMKECPNKIQTILDNKKAIENIAKKIQDRKFGFYLGRGNDYSLVLEGSLKMKEISYMHTEAFPSGELKHGPISLVVKGTFVLFLATDGKLVEKTLSNIKEVKARGAFVVVITSAAHNIFEDTADIVFEMPDIDDEVAPLISIVPLQLLAYYVSLLRGCDIDKPRNLAKSVTVE